MTSRHNSSNPATKRHVQFGDVTYARFPPGDSVRASKEKVGSDRTVSRRIISLTHHIARILFSLLVARKNSPSGKQALRDLSQRERFLMNVEYQVKNLENLLSVAELQY